MAIKETITLGRFRQGFPESYRQNFSYVGLEALYNYFNELSEDMEQDIEYDPIAICCEWAEYSSLEDLQLEYPDIATMEDLGNETSVILIPETSMFIIQRF